jgi:hypothetical protein
MLGFKHTCKELVLCSIAVVLIGATQLATGARQDVYFRFTDPMGQGPSEDVYDAKDNPDGWRNDQNNTGEVMVASGSAVYFGIKNKETAGLTKSLHLDLNWNGYNPRNTFSVSAVGYYNGQPVTGNVNSKDNKNKIRVSWPENCPKWEYVKLTNKATTSQTVTITPTLKQSKCYKPNKRTADGGPGPDDTFEITEGTFGVITEMLTPMRITEIQMYAEHQEIDQAVLPMFNALPHTGNWSAEFVFVDPAGTPRTGVRFVSDGPGLMAEDVYDLNFAMIESADTRYTLFAFDADDGEWTDYIVDLFVLPWYEDFEIFANDELLHGSSGWRGWDDDPVFDAPTSNNQSRSDPNSVEIKDDSDLVRVFDGADKGAWTFEAWQYIPSDFASGGGGVFDGSYFVLMNTYTDGVPHLEGDWSVQLQVDSNIGMIKFYHGDDINTIDVPYETDRWVKIQAEIDLEQDWTQIYYDDELVTEYSWTGGIIGNGGGALDIAAVDLYAQGSTSIYYDDLILEANPSPSVDCPADLNMDGNLDFFDVSFFINNSVDFNNDGSFNFFDVSEFINAFAAGCPSL